MAKDPYQLTKLIFQAESLYYAIYLLYMARKHYDNLIASYDLHKGTSFQYLNSCNLRDCQSYIFREVTMYVPF